MSVFNGISFTDSGISKLNNCFPLLNILSPWSDQWDGIWREVSDWHEQKENSPIGLIFSQRVICFNNKQLQNAFVSILESGCGRESDFNDVQFIKHSSSICCNWDDNEMVLRK